MPERIHRRFIENRLMAEIDSGTCAHRQNPGERSAFGSLEVERHRNRAAKLVRTWNSIDEYDLSSRKRRFVSSFRKPLEGHTRLCQNRLPSNAV